MSFSAFVYVAGERLSEAELSAACLDGHLVALGEAFVPADVVESPALRAASLVPLLGDTLCASLLTAAWVHGGVDDPPLRHTVQRAVPQRLHHVIDRRLQYRDPFVPPRDLVHLAGAPVTSRGRTGADLARTPGEAHTAALRTWAARDALVVGEATAWLEQHPLMPYRRRALSMLRELQDDVTR